jgi:hypothetical protein
MALSSGCHFENPEGPSSVTKFENFGPCYAQVREPGEPFRISLKKTFLIPHIKDSLLSLTW